MVISHARISVRTWPAYFWLYFGVVQSRCYLPGPFPPTAPDHFICVEHVVTTLCCPSGYTCFDNGLCAVTDPNTGIANLTIGAATRGACTDPKWNDDACGNFCLDDPVNENDGSLRSCGDGRWCCEPSAIAGTCDCETGDGTFSLRNGTAQTIIGIEGLEYTSTEVIPTATSSALSKSATAAASTTTVAAASSVSAVPSAPLSSTATSRATLTSSAIIPATALASRESRASTYMTTRLTTSSSTSTVNSSLRSETPTGQASANKGGKLSTPSIAIISAIAGVVGTALAGMILYFCRKRRAKRRKREREQQANRNSRHSDSDIQLQPNAPAITPITFPDPYDPTSTPFFGQRNADQRRTSRSGINLTMRPDHDPQRDSQPNLTRTPPMDPYNRPQSGSNTQMPRHTSSFSIHEERTTTPSSFHSVRNPYSPGPPPRYESVPDRTSTTRISNIPRGDTVRTAQRAPPMPHPRRPVINNTASR